MTHNYEILHPYDLYFLTCAKGSNPRHALILGYGCVPLDEIYVAVSLRVVRSEFSLYP